MDRDLDLSGAELTGTPFDGYLKYRTYRLGVEAQTREGGFVHGPGHFVSAIAALAFDREMVPYCTFKTGDTRLSRWDRGEPYVRHGIVAGRMDKEGASAVKIVLAELAEEVGGEVVDGTFLHLGQEPSPTMPWESTEADIFHLAAIEISGTPYGDGGAMEVVDLIGPLMLSAAEARTAMDQGEIAEGARARALYGRAFDAIGYLPLLEAFVHDHPRLLERFSTLGLGAPLDLRARVEGSDIPPPKARGESLESRINEVVCDSRAEHRVDTHALMVEARTHHAVRDGELLTTLGEQPFRNEYLHLDYDRAKVAVYYLDRQRGPLVQMSPRDYPALAFAPATLRVRRRDLEDFPLARSADALQQIRQRCGGEVMVLGEKTSASSGQCDLYYHFAASWVVELPVDADSFVPLAEAIALCRCGHGDAQTEGLLQRLADRLGWIPGLGMSLGEARPLLESRTMV
jgi:hypothetical protein